MSRKSIDRRVVTGVRAIDSLLTVGKGQRLGIFAGSGVGKSTLLSTIARNTSADINVIALIGERGREVKDFIENDLGDRQAESRGLHGRKYALMAFFNRIIGKADQEELETLGTADFYRDRDGIDSLYGSSINF